MSGYCDECGNTLCVCDDNSSWSDPDNGTMDAIRHLQGLLAECREWMNQVEQLGYDRIDPTLRAAIDTAIGVTR